MKKNKKINILMISSSSTIGGGTKHMFSLGRNLSCDFKVYYAIPRNKIFRNYLKSNCHIEISERKLNLFDILRLIKFVKSKSIDIIHAHGKGAGLLARLVVFLRPRPLIYTFHGIHLKCHGFISRFIYILYEFLLGGLDSAKVLVSKSEKNYALKSNIFLGNKSIIIFNGVNNMPKKSFNSKKNIETKNLKSEKIKVISICRFVDQKNIEEIIKIAEKMHYLNFLIIGNGPLWEKIRNIILEKSIKNVSLIGEKKDIFKYLYESDIYLSTSLYEGLPISILEAMSVGLPVVASNVIGNCDTIENGKSGFLYELKDIKNAVYYLNKLYENINLRHKLGNSAFLRQREIFSKELMIENYKNLYKKNLKF